MTTSYHISPSHNGHHSAKNVFPRSNTLIKSYGKSSSFHNGNLASGEVTHSNMRRPNNQYSSSASLHSELGNSSNASPISSPQPVGYRSMTINANSRTVPSTFSRSNSNSNLKSMKRWSASQDVRLSSLEYNKYVSLLVTLK